MNGLEEEKREQQKSRNPMRARGDGRSQGWILLLADGEAFGRGEGGSERHMHNKVGRD